MLTPPITTLLRSIREYARVSKSFFRRPQSPTRDNSGGKKWNERKKNFEGKIVNLPIQREMCECVRVNPFVRHHWCRNLCWWRCQSNSYFSHVHDDPNRCYYYCALWCDARDRVHRWCHWWRWRCSHCCLCHRRCHCCVCDSIWRCCFWR